MGNLNFDAKTRSYYYDYYDHRVFLNDNNLYYLDSRCVVETVCDAQHGDWKTVAAQGIKPIPKGTQLRVYKVWQNFYGVWIQVFYGGRYYDLHPRSLKYVRREVQFAR